MKNTVNKLLISLVTGLLAGGCLSKAEPKEEPRPNVLLILTDQHTNDAISYLGNPNLHTPALDRLAREGVYFTESYCTSPVCGPARSSLLTGRMPHETGVVWNSTNIDPAYPTVGQLFERAGYNSVWAGKWHLPEGYPAQSNRDSVRGFRVLPFESLEASWDTGEATDAPIADAVVNYLDNYQEEKPFLLAVSLHNPHDICYVPRRPDDYAKADQIEESLPPLPPNFAVADNEPEFLQEKRRMDHYGEELLLTRDYSKQDWQAYLYHYYRFTEMVDQQIGKILDALRANGLEENTLVVLTSEHGDGGAAHQWAAKLSLYQEAATVPFIIRWKGHLPAGVIDRVQLVSGIDVTPTLCDYAGIDPADFTGQSLRPVLDNPQATLREQVVVELADDKLDSTRHARMIRNRRYKYNLYNQGSRNEQLFDLWKDPGETQNLAEQATYQAIKNELKEALFAWTERTGDDFKE